ncbi:ATP-binding protein [Cupriavidus consociatus]|uniref:ATP-binding protein n=1 Tax=Cupriavidus consociatus TaxID=2821357 RepID=UPI001AE3343F|nr:MULTISPECIES: ATP-binding protein [unclassified Cupriavidus]MBP0620844.1 ATP-binding protein [Cupriavidus sp. LEh25]MDK2657506.1 ATP-binding protein [Cupriavidus sp. LEh21]
MEEVRAPYPDAVIQVHQDGDLAGRWDADRIGQLVVNLLVNAVRHGSGEIRLFAAGRGKAVVLEIENDGNPIPPGSLSYAVCR